MKSLLSCSYVPLLKHGAQEFLKRCLWLPALFKPGLGHWMKNRSRRRRQGPLSSRTDSSVSRRIRSIMSCLARLPIAGWKIKGPMNTERTWGWSSSGAGNHSQRSFLSEISSRVRQTKRKDRAERRKRSPKLGTLFFLIGAWPKCSL